MLTTDATRRAIEEALKKAFLEGWFARSEAVQIYSTTAEAEPYWAFYRAFLEAKGRLAPNPPSEVTPTVREV